MMSMQLLPSLTDLVEKNNCCIAGEIKLKMKEKVNNAASLCDLHDTLQNRIRALEGSGLNHRKMHMSR